MLKLRKHGTFTGSEDEYLGVYADAAVRHHALRRPLDHADGSVTDEKIGTRTLPLSGGSFTGTLSAIFARIASALEGKEDALTFDTAPTAGSTNPVTSGGIKTALSGKEDTLTFDTAPTAGSTNPVTSGGVKTALNAKEDTLTFDTAPTAGSTNPVTSGGVKQYTDAVCRLIESDDLPLIGEDRAVYYLTETDESKGAPPGYYYCDASSDTVDRLSGESAYLRLPDADELVTSASLSDGELLLFGASGAVLASADLSTLGKPATGTTAPSYGGYPGEEYIDTQTGTVYFCTDPASHIWQSLPKAPTVIDLSAVGELDTQSVDLPGLTALIRNHTGEQIYVTGMQWHGFTHPSSLVPAQTLYYEGTGEAMLRFALCDPMMGQVYEILLNGVYGSATDRFTVKRSLVVS